ncbi:YdeI family protein [Ciceribacter sp. RN22]|uniref:YdeI/OmpD-associated family protein n=1 Tax=Ciceribacter sp. RN22 TaxID=2954932 RepID=UPI0020935A9D|nr:YdeI/OmpD-associated family protein [Ciceribacter sp. RN22]MCO6178256.1 YdeI/OmpD-associated family protein [Ciceribacter sp. RN22]
MSDERQKLNTFFSEAKVWSEELRALRAILLDCGLTEEFKWRGPCYTYDGGNVAVIWGFKENAALGFFRGVLLKDPEGLLVAPGDNSRAVRMFKFTGLDQITAIETTIRTYVREAIELEKAGAKVDLPKDDIVYPEELVAALEEDPNLQEAFEALTPGRKRGYALHFAQPKQSATRRSRIEKSRDRILAGKRLQER